MERALRALMLLVRRLVNKATSMRADAMARMTGGDVRHQR